MPETSKSRSGATGPRTSAGKKRSSENSRKHGIFSRNYSEQDEGFGMLCDSICEELRAVGVVEQQICRQLGQNLVERERIETFAWGSAKATMSGFASNLEEEMGCDSGWFRPCAPQGAPDGYVRRMRPQYCAILLAALKHDIECRGLVFDKDMEVLKAIYGSEPTHFAEMIALQFSSAAAVNCQSQAGQPGQKVMPPMECLNAEIKFQKGLYELTLLSNREHVLECVVIPSDPIMDRVARYRAANGREFGRLLANLEALRRLKTA